jgi:protein tyrosine/serine phosphatase
MLEILVIFLSFNIIEISFASDHSDRDDMNYIIDNIYLGNKVAADNEELLKEHGITHVINCANSINSRYKSLRFLTLSMHDVPEQKIFPKFDIGYKFIKANSKGENKIYIHCYEGTSRSASLVIYYIMREKEWDYDKSYEYVKSKRPWIRPNKGFRKQLREYSDKHFKKKN